MNLVVLGLKGGSGGEGCLCCSMSKDFTDDRLLFMFHDEYDPIMAVD